MATKNQAAAELGRLGAAVTNAKLTAAERREKARKAARARWAKAPASVRSRGRAPKDQEDLFSDSSTTERRGRRRKAVA